MQYIHTIGTFLLLLALAVLGVGSVQAAEVAVPYNRDTVKTLAATAAESVIMVKAYGSVPVRVISISARNGKVTIDEYLDTERTLVSTGSGFFVTEDGYIATNRHVVADQTLNYRIVIDDEELPVRVVYRDPEHDVAILKVTGDDYPLLTLASNEAVAVDERVMAMGNAFGKRTDSFTVGRITDVDETIWVEEVEMGGHDEVVTLTGLIATTAKVYPGDSGGPLLNADGEVIGITVATAIGARAGFALPAELVEAALAKVEAR